MARNTCEMWFNGTKAAFFPKTYKKSPHRPPSVIRLSYTSFLNTYPNLNICTFQLLVKTLSLCKIVDKSLQATISNFPSYDIFVPQKDIFQKNFFIKIFQKNIFGKILMTSLHVICGLSPPIKNCGYAYKLEIAWKIFLKHFFFSENTCACVLGPWPWPRAFLLLASRV